MSIKSILKRFIPPEVRAIRVNLIKWRYRRIHNLQLINTKYECIAIGDDKTDTYFGYYDITPFNTKDEIIYLEVPLKSATGNIILNNITGNNKQIVASTNAFNTQQGSRLRYFPGSDKEIMFNDYSDGKYFCRILNIETKEERIISNPVYDITQQGDKYVTLNFGRLGVLRPGYGYTNIDYVPIENLSKEGICIYSVSSGELIADITYEDIARAMGASNVDYSNFYINHLSFSPDGSKLLFFWIKKLANWDQANLLTYNLNTKEMYVHEREYKVSHYTWFDNNTILCTAIKGNNRENMECRYYIYVEGKERQIVGADVLQRDGHPTYYTPDIILSDTYPDIFGLQELFLYNTITSQKKQLVLSNSVNNKGTEEFRTDMHPRFNSNKTIICYDANVSGYRRLYILKNWE